jgi:hypothetical protein
VQIFSKILPAAARRLPITGFAHKAAVIGDPQLAAIVAPFDMSSQRRRSAALDRRHDLQLAEADVPGVGLTPRRAVAAEDIRHLDRRPRHGGSTSVGRRLHHCKQSVERAGDLAENLNRDLGVACRGIQLLVSERSRVIIHLGLTH